VILSHRMPQESPTTDLAAAQAFRQGLVTYLAFGRWWTRRLALHGRLPPGLASQLGVRADVLREAAVLSRSGLGFAGRGPKPLVVLDVELPEPIFAEISRRATSLGTPPRRPVAARQRTVAPARTPRRAARERLFTSLGSPRAIRMKDAISRAMSKSR